MSQISCNFLLCIDKYIIRAYDELRNQGFVLDLNLCMSTHTRGAMELHCKGGSQEKYTGKGKQQQIMSHFGMIGPHLPLSVSVSLLILLQQPPPPLPQPILSYCHL